MFHAMRTGGCPKINDSYFPFKCISQAYRLVIDIINQQFGSGSSVCYLLKLVQQFFRL